MDVVVEDEGQRWVLVALGETGIGLAGDHVPGVVAHLLVHHLVE